MQIQEQLDRLFADCDRPGVPGFAIGVVEDGRLTYSKGFGCANLEQNIPIAPCTVFHCASVSKQFTAMSIALLEEQGLIKASDDVRLYLPELPHYSAAITMANLVYMTNGLLDIYDLAGVVLGIREDDYFTREQAWEMVKACDWLMFRPGERWSYGNTGYFLLAEIVERVSGQTLSEFAARNIFEPLGMSSTFFRDDRAMLIPRRAESYSDYMKVHYNDRRPSWCSRGQKYAIDADLMALPGAGGLWTTVLDLYKWDQNFYRNRLGQKSPDLVRRLTTPGKLNDGSSAPYGYGLFLRSKSGFRYVFHGGSAYGWSSAIYRIPDKRFSVICLGNYSSLFDQIEVYPASYGLLDQVAELVVEGYHAQSSVCATAATGGEAATGAYSELVGEYQNPDNSWIWHITLEDGKLKVRENYSEELALTPRSAETLVDSSGRLLVHFVHEQGPVGRLEVCRGDQVSTYYRSVDGLDEEALGEYAGDYYCQRTNTGFSVSVEAGRLAVRNHNRHNTGIDLNYRPTVKDSFVANAPPHFTWYCITFLRDETGKIVSFVYRDDAGSERENFVFNRVH